MDYGDMRTQFLAILNRSDCTDTLAKTFFSQSLARIGRELRSPDMVVQNNINASSADVSTVAVPSDFIEMQAFVVVDADGYSVELDYKPLGVFVRKQNIVRGVPVFYTRQGANFLVTDAIAQGSTAYFTYWGKQPALVNDTDETPLAVVAPDLIIYGALTYAADYFLDDRGSAWEGKFTSFLATTEAVAEEETGETGNMAIEPVHYYDDGVE